MKKNLILIIVGLASITAVSLLLSLIGHFEIWIFSNSFNDNLFISGGLVFILGLFTQNNTSQFAKGMSVLYTGKNENPEQHRGQEKSRFSILITLLIMFAITCLLSFFLPDIRL